MTITLVAARADLGIDASSAFETRVTLWPRRGAGAVERGGLENR
jgi:hypothetical protein